MATEDTGVEKQVSPLAVGLHVLQDAGFDGKREKAFAFALDRMEKYPVDEENRVIWVVHTDAEKEAQELAAMIEERFNFKPDVTIMGPVIGSHVGPGSVSVLWKSVKERDN